MSESVKAITSADLLAKLRNELAVAKASTQKAKGHQGVVLLAEGDTMNLSDAWVNDTENANHLEAAFSGDSINMPDTMMTDEVVGSFYVSRNGGFVPAAGASMVMYLRFEDNNSAIDYTSTINNGTVGCNPVLVAGIKRNNAMLFDAVDDVVTMPDDANIRVAAAFSFFLWIFPTSFAQDAVQNRRIVNKSDDANNAYSINITTGGLVQVSVTRAAANVTRQSTGALILNAYNHVGFTYNAGTIAIYINGISQGLTTPVAPTFPTAPDLIIGRLTASSGRYAGIIDQVGFFNKVLSSTEVITVMARSQLFAQDLVGFAIVADGGATPPTPASKTFTIDAILTSATATVTDQALILLDAGLIAANTNFGTPSPPAASDNTDSLLLTDSGGL